MSLIPAHLANLGKPGTYAEVTKGLKAANVLEVEVPSVTESVPIFSIIMWNKHITKTMPANTTMDAESADPNEGTVSQHTPQLTSRTQTLVALATTTSSRGYSKTTYRNTLK